MCGVNHLASPINLIENKREQVGLEPKSSLPNGGARETTEGALRLRHGPLTPCGLDAVPPGNNQCWAAERRRPIPNPSPWPGLSGACEERRSNQITALYEEMSQPQLYGCHCCESANRSNSVESKPETTGTDTCGKSGHELGSWARSFAQHVGGSCFGGPTQKTKSGLPHWFPR